MVAAYDPARLTVHNVPLAKPTLRCYDNHAAELESLANHRKGMMALRESLKVLQDMRIYHGGMPNTSDTVRPEPRCSLLPTSADPRPRVAGWRADTALDPRALRPFLADVSERDDV